MLMGSDAVASVPLVVGQPGLQPSHDQHYGRWGVGHAVSFSGGPGLGRHMVVSLRERATVSTLRVRVGVEESHAEVRLGAAQCLERPG